MLRCIPSIRPKDMNSFFFIDSRVSFYEFLKESSKITERFGHDILLTTEMNMQWGTDSVTMVHTTVPNVMSYLTDGDDTTCLDDDLSDEDECDDDQDNVEYPNPNGHDWSDEGEL